MTLVDSCVWIALAIPEHAFHDAAEEWLASQSKRNDVLFCRVTQQSFLRLLTTKAVLAPYGSPPLTNAAAWSMYDRFREDRRISFVGEPDELEKRWRGLTNGERPSPTDDLGDER